MSSRNVNLTEYEDDIIDAGIAAGRFCDASEAVRAGLHLLEREQEEEAEKLTWLRSAAQEGIDAIERGDYTTLCSRDDIRSFVQNACITQG